MRFGHYRRKMGRSIKEQGVYFYNVMDDTQYYNLIEEICSSVLFFYGTVGNHNLMLSLYKIYISLYETISFLKIEYI